MGSPYSGVEMWIKHQQQVRGERNIALGKAEGVADCTAEEACAWYFEYCSNERNRKGFEHGDQVRLEVRDAARINEKPVATIKSMPSPFTNREFKFKNILKRNEDGNLSIGSWPIDIEVDYGGKFKAVRGIGKGLLTASNIGSVSGVDQCRIIFRQYIDFGGLIPVSILNRKVPKQLSCIKFLADSFQHGEEIDRAVLASLANTIKNEAQIYTEQDEEAIKRGLAYFDKYNGSQKHKELKSNDPYVTLKFVHIEGESLGVGVARAIVDASVEDCAAYEYLKDSREKLAVLKKKRVMEQKVKKISNHSQLYLSVRSLGVPGLSNREWRMRSTWKHDEVDGR